MPPVHQPIVHLSQLLENHVPMLSSQPPSQADLDGFFQSISTHRIRINSHDWQGHPVNTLLWHLPNLRPDRQTALVAYLVGKWDNYVAGTLVKSAVEKAGTDTAHPPAAAVQPDADAPPIKMEKNEMNDSTSSQNFFLTNRATTRRDWFDRFTDWVVAVISLFE